MRGRIFPRGVEDKMRIHQKPRRSTKKYKVPRTGEKPKPKDDYLKYIVFVLYIVDQNIITRY